MTTYGSDEAPVRPGLAAALDAHGLEVLGWLRLGGDELGSIRTSIARANATPGLRADPGATSRDDPAARLAGVAAASTRTLGADEFRLAAADLALVGHGGGRLWRAFVASDEARDGAPDPLDRWSRRILRGVATAQGAMALFPFDGPPWLPFVGWAQRAGAAHASPLGLAIHRCYGLWHGYRGALLFAPAEAEAAAGSAAAEPGAGAGVDRASPCRSCPERPCLEACPVAAFGASGFDAGACRRYLASAAGGECRAHGCGARRACPVGREHRYGSAQQLLHMDAFRAGL